jgi:hypothetical protein
MGARLSRRRKPLAEMPPNTGNATPPAFENYRRIRFISETEATTGSQINSEKQEKTPPPSSANNEQAAVHTFRQSTVAAATTVVANNEVSFV